MVKVTKRGDLDGKVLNIENKLCIDGNCNVIDNGNPQQTKWPLRFLNGFGLVYNTETTISILPGNCRDENDTHNASTTSNLVVSTLGGLDTGSPMTNTWYAVHVIIDITDQLPVQGLLSLSIDSPTLPAGYNTFRRVGWIRIDSDGTIRPFIMNCQGWLRTYHYVKDRAVLGRLTVLFNGQANVWTTIDLSVVMPPTSRHITLLTEFQITDPDDVTAFRPTGSKYGLGVGVAFPALVPEQVSEAFLSPYAIKPSISVNESHTYLEMCTSENQEIDYLTALLNAPGAGDGVDISIIAFIDELS